MKPINLYLFIIMISFFSASFAQPVLTSNMIPGIGNGYIKYNVTQDTNIIDIATVGANITWNFSSLSIPVTGLSYTYTPVGGTPYEASYPYANVAALEGASTYYYYVMRDTVIELYGNADVSVGTAVYNNTAKLMTYPFTYNDFQTDNFSGTHKVNAFITGSVTGTVTATGDAYGTLILPLDTFHNVLRVKETFAFSDVVIAGTLYSSLTGYYWFSPDFKNPLLQVEKVVTTGLQSNYFKTAYVNRPYLYTGTSIKERNTTGFNFIVFPNPAGSEKRFITYILEKPSAVKISLLNMMGQELQTSSKNNAQAGKQTESIDLSGLSAGIYFIRLNVAGLSSQQKIVIQ
jgi:hypothetical protein